MAEQQKSQETQHKEQVEQALREATEDLKPDPAESAAPPPQEITPEATEQSAPSPQTHAVQISDPITADDADAMLAGGVSPTSEPDDQATDDTPDFQAPPEPTQPYSDEAVGGRPATEEEMSVTVPDEAGIGSFIPAAEPPTQTEASTENQPPIQDTSNTYEPWRVEQALREATEDLKPDPAESAAPPPQEITPEATEQSAPSPRTHAVQISDPITADDADAMLAGGVSPIIERVQRQGRDRLAEQRSSGKAKLAEQRSSGKAKLAEQREAGRKKLAQTHSVTIQPPMLIGTGPQAEPPPQTSGDDLSGRGLIETSTTGTADEQTNARLESIERKIDGMLDLLLRLGAAGGLEVPEAEFR